MKKIILALSFLFIAGSASAQNVYDKIAYSYNNNAITAHQLNQKIQVMALSHGLSLKDPKQAAEAKQLALDTIMEGLLLHERGKALGAKATPEQVEQRLKQFMQKQGMNSATLEIWLTQNNSNLDALKNHLESKMIQDAILDQFVKGAISLSEDSIRKIYEELGATEYEIQARHILFLLPEDSPDFRELDSVKYAIEIRNKILRKEISFTKAAKTYSGDPSAQGNAGDLGTFKQGMMVSTFTDASVGLPINAISYPVRSQYGYHLIQVTGRKKVAKPALQDDAARFKQLAFQVTYNKKKQHLIQSLKKEAQIIEH